MCYLKVNNVLEQNQELYMTLLLGNREKCMPLKGAICSVLYHDLLSDCYTQLSTSC